MKTGVDYIKEERQSQIEKHGYTVEHHRENMKWYVSQQLVQAADFCIQIGNPVVMVSWPREWMTTAKDKIISKSRIGQLACAGAFILAQQEVFGNHPMLQLYYDYCVSEIDKLLAK